MLLSSGPLTWFLSFLPHNNHLRYYYYSPYTDKDFWGLENWSNQSTDVQLVRKVASLGSWTMLSEEWDSEKCVGNNISCTANELLKMFLHKTALFDLSSRYKIMLNRKKTSTFIKCTGIKTNPLFKVRTW